MPNFAISGTKNTERVCQKSLQAENAENIVTDLYGVNHVLCMTASRQPCRGWNRFEMSGRKNSNGLRAILDESVAGRPSCSCSPSSKADDHYARMRVNPVLRLDIFQSRDS